LADPEARRPGVCWLGESAIRAVAFAVAAACTLAAASAQRVRALSDPPLNFVVLLTDDQRFDSLWAMPLLEDRLGARSVRFENALVTNPLCCPMRSSFLSGGFYPHSTGVINNTPPNGGAPAFVDSPSIATALQEAGYATGLVGKYLNEYNLIYPRIPPGWTSFAGAIGTSFSLPYYLNVGSTGALPGQGVAVGPGTVYGTYEYRDRALAFIDAHADEPFFLYVAFDAVHTPATPAPGDEDLFANYVYRGRGFGEVDVSDKPARIVAATAQYPDIMDEQDAIHRDMLRSLQAVDRAVADVVDRLQALGILDRTVVVFASDNGYMWGEHGLPAKREPYEESVRVPLWMAVPGVPPRSDEHLVSLDLDVPVTLLDLAGVPWQSDGVSLLPLLEDPNDAVRTEALIEHAQDWLAWAGLRVMDERGNWKYVEYSRGWKELYDLDADPYELESRHADPALQPLVAELSAELAPLKGLAATTHTAPKAHVGVPYALPLNAWGGKLPYTWSLAQGPLPAGLSLDASTATVRGTPTEIGARSVVLRVEDSSTGTQSGHPETYNLTLAFGVVSACSDGVDNDGDGAVDFPADPGCRDAASNLENPKCDDGLDNDHDGKIDWDGGGVGPPDPQCSAGWGSFEGELTRPCGLGFELAPLAVLLAWLGGRRRRA
jgi:N-acetylglucosamine-6-sulfatase